MFIAMPGTEINDDNEIQQIIADKTGVKVKETWLTGQTDAEAIGTIIAGGDYPDFINGGEAMMQLYDNDVLVPLHEIKGPGSMSLIHLIKFLLPGRNGFCLFILLRGHDPRMASCFHLQYPLLCSYWTFAGYESS